jgi:hypothetical protein
MIESQIAQLAAVVPPSNKGKILGQPKDLETANLFDIHNAASTTLNRQRKGGLTTPFPTRKMIQGDPSFASLLDITSFRKLSVTSEQVSTSCPR